MMDERTKAIDAAARNGGTPWSIASMAYDAAVAAERERCAKVCEERFSEELMEYNSIEAFDVRAEAFRRMTGMMAPGKDESAAGGGVHTYEERCAAFDAWYKQHGECVRAVMKATEAICQREGDLP